MRQIKILALLLMMALPLMVKAQDFSWMDNAPGKYLPKATQEIVNRESPCNQGEEAFMDFIPKFRTDKAFRNSRAKFAEDDEMGKMSLEMLGDWNNGNGYALLKAKNTKRMYCTWYNVSANEVCLKMEEFGYGEWGGSSMFARFQRIDGKWYMTGLMMAG